MKLNKKVIESMAVTSAMLVMTTITAFGSSTEDSASGKLKSVAENKDGRAGIIHDLYHGAIDIQDESNFAIASIEKVQTDVVSDSGIQPKEVVAFSNGVGGFDDFAAETMRENLQEENQEAPILEEALTAEAAEETTGDFAALQETAGASEEEAEWANLVMADVQEDMNIRTEPNETSKSAGKFYRGDVAEILSVEEEWTQITSGNVTGYVKNDYLVYGMEANDLANEVCSLYATVNTDGLRLRKEPSETAAVITTAKAGDELKVDKDAVEQEGWVAVHTSGATAYVSAEYVEVALNLGTALNNEEVAAKEAKEAQEKAAEAAKKPAQNASVDEVTLLGALIQCEAGGGSYEGMVAVGAVVMNRVRSGAYPGTISGVIYQGGQFPPALNGSVASLAARGVSGACLQAAQEAINGTDNTNGALSFRSASSGAAGTLIGANVFF